MAMQINASLNTGLQIEAGYFKVENIALSNTSGELYFTGALYANRAAREAGRPPVERHYYANRFAPADKTGNLLEQAYNYIKELAAGEGHNEAVLFADAIDV